MKKILTTSLLMLAALIPASAQSSVRYAGGDISLLPDYEKAGAQYRDQTGKQIADFIPWCHDQGMNAMRVRLFVNPASYKDLHQNDTNQDTKYDPNACQDLDYILPLCKRIVDSGMALMLDFHYSDTWADPAKQWTPTDWVGLDDAMLADALYDYTKDILLTLKENGVVPAFIQTGNEISYGMLWGSVGTSNPLKALMGNSANWARLGQLLNKAGAACREVCPDAKIVLHTERVTQTNVLTYFYKQMRDLGVDYDIIGLSYYPYFHGDLSVLEASLNSLEQQFPTKKIMVVETGYALKWDVPGTQYHFTDKWPLSDAGQAQFAKDLVGMLERHESVDGLFWWWMEYNPYNTSLSGWYNASLIDPSTGRVTSAFKEICSFATPASGVDTMECDEAGQAKQWYDLQGRPVRSDYRGLKVASGRKQLVP